ncbi:hypothetical protein [Thermomonas flagellata]|uniref:hypothetical protein n=1 Tax=Thermomonas flagellata TaxID=2888524 RepID=UPI001F0356FF|nr:hypothetical protein [Thermomonas flagellata]
MLLAKTPRALAALQAGSRFGLSLRERRALILADGRRRLDELLALLGSDALPLLQRLRDAGLLEDAAQALTNASHVASAPPPLPARAPAAPAASTPAAPRGGQRRSLVAAKLYVVDMLQLQRHPDAVELKARIQFAADQDALLAGLFEAVPLLRRLTSPRYGERVAARLQEVLPEDLLPALAAALASAPAGAAGADARAP